jgi:DGQHR domain-containing protein
VVGVLFAIENDFAVPKPGFEAPLDGTGAFWLEYAEDTHIADGSFPFGNSMIACSDERKMLVTKFTIAAARVRQGALVLYTTSMKVRQLVSDGFYNVETLDPEDTDAKGYQRLLNTARAKKLADYIVKGQDSQDAFLPTSVLLATDKSIDFDEQHNRIEIDISLVGPFSVVDGQHRLEGLKMAAEKDKRVLDFEVPVNIAINLLKIAQMCHFLIVNTTQKSVDKSVEQRIIARLSEALEVEDMPSLPKWILNTVERGEVDKALKYVDYLNETEGSPWFGKIRMANSESEEATINQRSFVKVIVKYVLTANNPLTVFKDFEKEKKIFLNYWKAIKSNLDDGNSETLYKYGGVELFCKFSIPFFMKLQDRGSYTVNTMEKLLKSCLENVEGDYAGVGHPDWWATGGQAGRLNAGALNIVAQEMSKALHKATMNSSFEL